MALYLDKKICLLEDTKAYLYRWTHVPTGKWYVGSRTAKGSHPEDGYYCSSKVVKPMIEQNPTDWKREILAIGEPKDMLELEAKFLTKLDAKHDIMSFNMHNGDGNFTTLGTTQDKEWLNKRIAKLTGQPKPEGFGANVSKYQKGSTRSEETKKRIGVASTGRPQSVDARRKNSIANGGENNPSFTGYCISPNGEIFDSSIKAAAKHGVTRQTIVSWAKSGKNGWSFKPKGEK